MLVLVPSTVRVNELVVMSVGGRPKQGRPVHGGHPPSAPEQILVLTELSASPNSIPKVNGAVPGLRLLHRRDLVEGLLVDADRLVLHVVGGGGGEVVVEDAALL